jgi:hypothetical protein
MAHTLLELLLSVAIGLIQRVGGLVEVVKVAQPVRHVRKGLGNRLPQRLLSITPPLPQKREVVA